jgi:hypothetical protein
LILDIVIRKILGYRVQFRGYGEIQRTTCKHIVQLMPRRRIADFREQACRPAA